MKLVFEHEPIYDPNRKTLYSQAELRVGYRPGEMASFDERVYCRFLQDGRLRTTPEEALSRRLHDYGIDMALDGYLRAKEARGLRLVGIMGGASKSRTDDYYRRVAITAYLLTREDCFVISGGGTGMMEAANLGAYMAPYGLPALEDAVGILAGCPDYDPPVGSSCTKADYIARALDVVVKYPNGAETLGVPTWFYGHEPTNCFASALAKYFSNSLREDGLLAIATDGIVYAPGSAGTTQEIFQDAAQNHYGTYEYRSPMVFLGRKRYSIETLLFPVLYSVASDSYRPLIGLADLPEEVVDFILHTEKIPVPASPSDCPKRTPSIRAFGGTNPA